MSEAHRPLTITARGHAVLNDPEVNKGTAFTAAERQALALGPPRPDRRLRA